MKLFGCIVRQSHTEILSQEEKQIENKLKKYIEFYIRTMHVTENPPEKAMIATSTIQAYKDNTRSLKGLTLCHSLPVKIHKFSFLFRNQLSKPRLSVCVCLPAQSCSS